MEFKIFLEKKPILKIHKFNYSSDLYTKKPHKTALRFYLGFVSIGFYFGDWNGNIYNMKKTIKQSGLNYFVGFKN